ncbi:MAG: hypothetical protein JWM80_3945 [Cyanobacteria bacterium RYN_339]|nr:hypothetical protein [Cyanobacteria bacterium RYN_339]
MSIGSRPRVVIVRPPVLHEAAKEGHRHSTWSELYYDLAFVAAIGILAQDLGAAFNPGGLLTFVALFVPLTWAWAGFTVYNDRFDTPDLFHRALTFVQVLGVATLALSVHQGTTAYAAAYVPLRLLLVWQYRRAGAANPESAALCRHYARGFSLGAACWLASCLAPDWLRYPLWACAMLVDLATPPLGRKLQVMTPLSPSHAVERFSLFTIILVGLTVAELINGAMGRPVTPGLMLAGTAGLAFTYALWWLYYDNLEGGSLRDPRRAGQVWVFAHLMLSLGITTMGVSAGHLVAAPLASTPERLAFGVAVATCFLALAALHGIVHCRDARFKAWSRLAAALLVLPLALVPLPSAFVLAAAAALALAQLGVELRRFGWVGEDFMDGGV